MSKDEWRSRKPHGFDLKEPTRDGEMPRNLDHMSHFKTVVYEPSDDTYLFVDVIRSLGETLRNDIFPTERALCCLEVGGGSGTLSSVLMEELKPRGAFALVTDCNAAACMASQQTLVANNATFQANVMRCDLIPQFQREETCDMFIFNPPYVPTESEEVDRHGFGGLEAAWAGGLHGREVLDRLLPMLARCMRQKSVLLILAVEENRPHEIVQYLEQELGYVCYLAGKRRAMNERLLVIMAVRNL